MYIRRSSRNGSERDLSAAVGAPDQRQLPEPVGTGTECDVSAEQRDCGAVARPELHGNGALDRAGAAEHALWRPDLPDRRPVEQDDQGRPYHDSSVAQLL